MKPMLSRPQRGRAKAHQVVVADSAAAALL
jgi:hypothetical protein